MKRLFHRLRRLRLGNNGIAFQPEIIIQVNASSETILKITFTPVVDLIRAYVKVIYFLRYSG